MVLMAQFDSYCERTDFTFWSEPVNALTNAAFLIAALATWRYGSSKPGMTGLAPWMIVLVAVIGTGSFLFHTFATGWAALMDVIPIAIYIYVFFGLAMRRMIGHTVSMSLVLAVGFFGLSIGIVQIAGHLVGSSAGYVPALLALFGISGYMIYTSRAQGMTLMVAAVLFLISLTARTLDEPICADFPLGVHFIWHCLNAVVLFTTLKALLDSPPPGHVRQAASTGAD